MAIPNEAAHPTFKDYLDKQTPKASFWINKPNFSSASSRPSGGMRPRGNDFAFDYLPKVGKGFEGGAMAGCPHLKIWPRGHQGPAGLGHEPGVSSNNLNQTYAGLDKLEWLVTFELFESDTAAFWSAQARTQGHQDRGLPLPFGPCPEKDGSNNNSGGWVRWGTRRSSPRLKQKHFLISTTWP